MDSYPVSRELMDWLDRRGMRGNGLAGPALHGKGAGTQVEVAHVPATANSGRDRAPISNKRTGIAPAKFHRESVNTDRGETVGVNYGTNIDAAMAAAMSNGMEWRVVRAMPLLMIANCRG